MTLCGWLSRLVSSQSDGCRTLLTWQCASPMAIRSSVCFIIARGDTRCTKKRSAGTRKRLAIRREVQRGGGCVSEDGESSEVKLQHDDGLIDFSYSRIQSRALVRHYIFFASTCVNSRQAGLVGLHHRPTRTGTNDSRRIRTLLVPYLKIAPASAQSQPRELQLFFRVQHVSPPAAATLSHLHHTLMCHPPGCVKPVLT
jgi:hypothetical protein